MSNTISAISPTSPEAAAAANQAANGGGQNLTQQDFLKIMVAQFTQQDPLSSGDGGGSSSGTSDYVNQLISMTNLTTLQTVSSQLTTSTNQQALSLGDSLNGATVTVNDANGNPITGVVQQTSVDNTTDNVLMTINGAQYSSANLVSIDQTAAQAAALAGAGTTTAANSTP